MLDIITGMQFGDEGKGRIVHNLALTGKYFAGARAQGGNNAGHTVVHDGEIYKLHLLPAPVLLGKKGYLGRAMVLDLDVLMQEIHSLQKRDLTLDLLIDPRAHVIMPWHKDLDVLNEAKNGDYAAGSTGRGIGPCYASKHERTGIRVTDFFYDNERVNILLEEYTRKVNFLSGGMRFDSIHQKYVSQIAETRSKVTFLEKYFGDVSQGIATDLSLARNILGECAQAEMLDVDGPYYPRGTSSGTSAVGFWNGIGVGPTRESLGFVIGVTKAYTTRVGKGPFVTEIEGDLAQALREKGGEYGTTTGRARRVGWLDIPMLKHALVPSGITHLALTKLDILGGMETFLIAEHYEDGDIIPSLGYEQVKPVYRTMVGWPAFSEEEYKRQFEHGVDYIPHGALRWFLQTLENHLERPIGMISFGQSSSAFVSYL